MLLPRPPRRRDAWSAPGMALILPGPSLCTSRAVLLRTLPGAHLGQRDEALIFRAARLDMVLHNRRTAALDREREAGRVAEHAAMRLAEARQSLAAAQAAVSAAAI